MLITSEHKKISRYVWLSSYVISGFLFGVGINLYFKQFQLFGISLLIGFFLNLLITLFLTTKEAIQNPKNIEILYLEKKTPKSVYIIWSIILILIVTFLGCLTFSILFNFLFR